MTTGLLLTAFGLGLRHGIDWDHIAAIADLSSTAPSRRRGFVLSFLYAVGHGAVVIVLGIAAIVFGAALPEGADVWMARVIGITLIALGSWVLIELLRKGRNFRLRSRWILVIGGTFAGLRRVKEAREQRRVMVEHEHEHPHAATGNGFDHDHAGVQAHDHHHDLPIPSVGPDGIGGADPDEIDIDIPVEIDVAAPVDVDPEVEAEVEVTADARGHDTGPSVAGESAPKRAARLVGRRPSVSLGLRRSGGHSHAHAHGGLSHSHRHRHEAMLADSASGTGNGTAAGIGLLHGIGFESPTQIAVFVASTSVVGAWAGLGLLVAWVIGLIVANSGLAILAAYGLLGAERNFVLYAAVAVLVGVASIAMGVLALTGIDALPALN